MQPETERLRQLSEGRSKLTFKDRDQGSKNRDGRSPQKTHKGHDSLLQKLLNTKDKIMLVGDEGAFPLITGFANVAPQTSRTLQCKVVAFDAFTVTVEGETPSGNAKWRTLVFKHAIKSILLPESFVESANDKSNR